MAAGVPIACGARAEIRALISQSLEAAASTPFSGPDQAIHELRKAVKMARALLRLLGREDLILARALGQVGRRLSALRDAAVMLETFDLVRRKCSADLRGYRLTSFRQALVRRKAALEEEAYEAVSEARRALLAIASQVGAKQDRRSSAAAALSKTAQRAGKAFRRARRSPDSETLHEWRKRAKEQWHQLRICQLDAHGEKRLSLLQRLADSLGAAHNIAMLLAALPTGGPQRWQIFRDRAAQCERAASGKALALGARIYGE